MVDEGHFLRLNPQNHFAEGLKKLQKKCSLNILVQARILERDKYNTLDNTSSDGAALIGIQQGCVSCRLSFLFASISPQFQK